MPKTLLLADDSVTIQKVVGITFANEDVDLVTVDNGDDALRRAREVMPDLVLADIGMPGLTGYELCAEIRRSPEIAHVPVLLLTGTFETYDEARAREVGASDHISKPFEAQALVQMVHRLLDEADAGQGATVLADPLAPPAELPAARAVQDPGDSGSNMLPEIADLPNTSFRDLGSHEDFATPEPAGPASAMPEVPEVDFGAGPGSAAPMPEVPETPFTAADDEPDPAPPHARVAPPPRAAAPAHPAAFPPLPPAEPLDAPPAHAYGDPDGETAFLDPLADFSRDTLATPRDADLPEPVSADPDVDPQGDTSPTYADGRPIVLSSAAPDDSGSDRAAAAEQSWAGAGPAAAEPASRPTATLPTPELPDFTDEPGPQAHPEPAHAASAEPAPAAHVHGGPPAFAAPVVHEAPEPALPSLDFPEADDDSEEIALVETAPDDDWAAPAALAEPEPLASTEPDLGDADDDGPSEPEIVPETETPAVVEPAVAAEPEPATPAPAPSAPPIDPDAVHGAIEKIAWEAFGSLSQDLVEQFTARVEAIVWEIVPQVAERLVREEIERLKRDLD